MLKSDVFVFLDNAQIANRGFTNRNKIKINNRDSWLTVPIVRSSGQLINEIKIDNTYDWRRKHWGSLYHAYHKAPFFNRYKTDIEKIYNREWVNIVDLNMEFITLFVGYLGINTKFYKSSELGINTNRTDSLIDICKCLLGSVYISGKGGENYMEYDKFDKADIKIEMMNFDPRSRLSVIDLIFNYGPDSRGELEVKYV